MYQAIVFLPLIGFLIAGLFGRAIGAKARNTSPPASDDRRGPVLGRVLHRRLRP
jgi:hypothetical protein